MSRPRRPRTNFKSMTRDDATIADLQQRLHDENQRRFEQIEKNQDNLASKFVELGKTLEEVVTNTSCLQQLKEDVADIEKDRNKIKARSSSGSAWVVSVCWLRECAGCGTATNAGR